MTVPNKTEAWQRGPVPGVPPLLQPVAHALLQAREEVNGIMTGFPEELLWASPAELASCGFHLQHLSGVLDRVFTYARNKSLTDEQFRWLRNEGKDNGDEDTLAALIKRFDIQVDIALTQLKTTDENTLTDFRGIGRAGLPSTVGGLLFHAAEHSMRHIGQLLVTAKVLRSS